MNGGRTEYNNWEMDGGDNMDNGSNTTLNVYPNLEAIAEFKVLTSNYGAQYGRNGSGTVEVETKSGRSSSTAARFYYGRNEIFNARSWEEGADPSQPKAPTRSTIGDTPSAGRYTFRIITTPIRRRHSSSGRRNGAANRTPTSLQQASAFRRGARRKLQRSVPGVLSDSSGGHDKLSGLPDDQRLGGHGISQQYDSGGTDQPERAIFPGCNSAATGSLTTNGFPAFVQTVSLPTTWREELIRVDQNFTENERLTVRYIHDSWQTTKPTPLWGNGASFPT